MRADNGELLAENADKITKKFNARGYQKTENLGYPDESDRSIKSGRASKVKEREKLKFPREKK